MHAADGDPPGDPLPLSALLADGDLAFARGDAATLTEIAARLAICVAPPLRDQLDEISRIARDDLGRAGDQWTRLARRLREAFEEPAYGWSVEH